MALQEPAPAVPPSAEVFGNVFVQQYYHLILPAINDKIISLNYGNYTAEIETADAQESHEKGVIVLVTGFLTGIDNVEKKFTQTFFLTPQDKGYFVLNDVFRFIGESESLPNRSVLVNGNNEKNQPTVMTPEPGWDDVEEPCSKKKKRKKKKKMVLQKTAPAAPPSAELVGNAFVQQYYHILHQSPELVHRFYHDSSLLGRPDSNGAMKVVTTMQAINDKILSLNYGNYTAEIKTADAQESHENGVIVLVTGFLTGIDNVKKKFTQTFFLAPQDLGYFVLNDVFRFIGESESLPKSSVSVNGNNEKNLNDGAEVCDPSDKEEGSVIEDEVVEPTTEEAQSEILTCVDLAPPSMEDTHKQSYSSILKVMKANTGSSPAHVPITHVRVAAANTEQQYPSAKPASAPEPTAPSSGSPPESSHVQEEAEGHSIFVRNLPFTATVEQLEEAFKRFGPIKQGGIRVRSNKMPTTSSTHVSVSLASSCSTLLDTSNNLLKKLSSLKKTQNSTSTSSSEILQDLQQKRKALKEYLGLSLEAIDEANAFPQIKRIALLLLQHSASSLERAILKYLVSSLAAFKEIVPATNSRMENVRARMLYLSWKKADVRSRLCQGQEQLSSLEVRFSKLLEEEWELKMQVWDLLLTTRDELSITKKSVSLELEMINEKVAADLEYLREISEEDELVANDWIQAREKLAQANLNWQLFKQNLELCEKSV